MLWAGFLIGESDPAWLVRVHGIGGCAAVCNVLRTCTFLVSGDFGFIGSLAAVDWGCLVLCRMGFKCWLGSCCGVAGLLITEYGV